MQADDICFLSISKAAKLLSDKEVSPVELVSAHLERIGETDGRLNSFITLLEDESMAAARAAEADIVSGGYRGPLHGIPIGLKDLFYTRGVRTTVGSKIMGDFVPDEDATVTQRLNEAGAILMGKLQMHEFALGATSANPHYGPAHNPWDTERITGGSSGGSGSSVASGQCMGALGSDTGGSVRIPAALCGIVGLKPTFGRVGRFGVFPLSWSLDTVGPMCRTVRDVALMLNVIAGHDPRDPSSSRRPPEDFTGTLEQGIDGTRIGIPREFFYDVLDSEVADAVSRAARVLEGLGASVEEVAVPMAAQSVPISQGVILPEGAEVHLDNLRHRAEEFDPVVRTRLETGVLSTATQYLKAQRARTWFNQQMAQVMEGVDVLLTPTAPIGAPKIGDEMAAVGDGREPVLTLLSRLTRPFNLCGVPAVTLPCGFTSAGLPIGLQLAGRPFDEATVLRLAHAYEQAAEWHERRPPL